MVVLTDFWLGSAVPPFLVSHAVVGGVFGHGVFYTSVSRDNMTSVSPAANIAPAFVVCGNNDDRGSPGQQSRPLIIDIARLNWTRLRELGAPEIATRISQYQMAYRLQASVPGLTDLSDEPARVPEAHGPDVRQPGTYTYNCLMARRLVERGVRFVQLIHAG
jgi:hypothetical protein